ncbi:DsbA family protein [Bacillus sp. HMF5848]|uniref:ClpXP adapter SpxH family protein n=1 Tax=Bacillus sp. HMF5848 TaxID=2495421 RepID=UPI000F786591|nr:ClpXP adapter SpxH family protein [Bacillus sp. HMF5848]RSK29279.1 DsbA family protein [Bacillus sp. HMF5848]
MTNWWAVHQRYSSNTMKPIEVYYFLDPLCAECWSLEPILKKLQIEYGRYFTVKHVLSGKLAKLNLGKKSIDPQSMAQVWERTANRFGMSCDGSVWFENPIETPFAASIAIKAAGLQGRRLGIQFIRKLQETLFIEKQDISDEKILHECADIVGLDVEEFSRDLHSPSAAKAFQCDLSITTEMEVDQIPTLVFFNEDVEQEGIKITGFYPFDTYVHILSEMLGYIPDPEAPPDLEDFLRYFKFVATKEISVVYNMPLAEAEHEMKKLVLKQKVEPVPVKFGTFWRYKD